MFVWDVPLWERRCVGTLHTKTPSHCLCEPTCGLQPADPPRAASPGCGRARAVLAGLRHAACCPSFPVSCVFGELVAPFCVCLRWGWETHPSPTGCLSEVGSFLPFSFGVELSVL